MLREVTIPFVTDNLRALITNVSAAAPASVQGSSGGLGESGGPIAAKPDSTVKLSWTTDSTKAQTSSMSLLVESTIVAPSGGWSAPTPRSIVQQFFEQF